MDQKKKIEEWLYKSGYPLELFAHAELLKSGFKCEKSDLYQDYETGKSREIDLVGSVYSGVQEEYGGTLKLLIECKKSDKPCLILTNASNEEDRFRQLFGSDILSHSIEFFGDALCGCLSLGENFASNENIDKLKSSSLVGYSLVQSFSNTDKQLYQATMGLTKAHKFYTEKAIRYFDKEQEKHQNKQDKYPFELIVPVLVIDAPLFYVYLDDKGDLALQESSWGAIEVKKPWSFEFDDNLTIQVVHKNSFSEFAHVCKEGLMLAGKQDMSFYIS